MAIKCVHPGQFLDTLLTDNHMSKQLFAAACNIDYEDVIAITQLKKDITPEIAAKLAIYFHTTTSFWFNLQENYNENKVVEVSKYDN